MKYDWSRCNCENCGGDTIDIELEAMVQTVPPVAADPTPWAIRCHKHGKVYLTNHEYNRQMNRANAHWECPLCPAWNNYAGFDDDNYEDAEKEAEENAASPSPS